MAAGSRKSRGQSAVEFALTLPIFLFLVIGIVDLGRGVTCYSLVANCAREGARAAIYPQTPDANIVAAINSQTLILGTIPSTDIAITPASPGARTSGSNITVAVTYRYQPITSVLSSLVGSTIVMDSSSTMLIE